MMEAMASQAILQNIIYKRKKQLSQSAHDRGKSLYQAVSASLPTGHSARTAYFHCIKDGMNIDPPYNTGNDFIYKDNYTVSEKENSLVEGEIDEAGERLIVNQKSSGKYHSNWLSMMYPRLKVAKDLLAEDGVIFISIDDNEVDNLRKICSEVFGEENFVGLFTIQSNPRGSQASKYLASVHEYICMCAKNINNLALKGFEKSKENISEYSLIDEEGKKYRLLGLRQRGGAWRKEDRPKMFYPIYVNPSNGKVCLEKDDKFCIEVLPKRPTGEESRWTWGKERFLRDIHLLRGKSINRIGKKNAWDVFRIDYLETEDGKVKTTKVKTMWVEKEINYQNGRNDIKELFSNSDIFDFPKPIYLINQLIRMIDFEIDENEIVLDFFSGSATTAHAVIQLNTEDGGNRKFIMVQLPEPCDEKSEAFKAGFKNISEIGKERIRRAGEKIKEENKDKEGIEDLDIGFKVFKVADTNIRWFSEALQSDQMVLDEAMMTDKDKLDFNPGYTDIDVVYEILLRHRDIPLSTNVEKLASIGARTYIFADTVVVCLEETITEGMIDQIAAIEPMPTKVIFRDSAFGDDISLKTNSMLRLEAQMKKHSGLKKKAYRVEFI
jgi:adenine-specific DNA-methyltransferase